MSELIEGDLLARITAPFDGAPCGEDLRMDLAPDALYSALRDARSEARAAERLAENDPSAPTGHDGWKTVEQLSVKALESRSKDIEIACWLMESLVRSRGLAGFADGAEILSELISRFWEDGIFPLFDEADPDYQLVAVAGLSGQERDGTLLQPLRRIPLFEQADGSPVTIWDYNRSRQLASVEMKDSMPASIAAIVPFGDIEASMRMHGQSRLRKTVSAAARAVEAWSLLEVAISSVTTDASTPSTSRVRDLLGNILLVAQRYVPAELPTEMQAKGPETTAAVNGGGPVGELTRSGPATRDAMLDDVLRIATVFRAREPGAPFSYTIEEAVRRARLSWVELLREMLPNAEARTGVLSGLGIRPPPE